ncbi:MAG: starch synthase [Gammaproteobacteria bacterium]|nr:MAG: starch synthase [Gammaproteobacteria bacterium]TND06653.1 MAG: starch synthase [Gammaproteobacteria bacterium]
MKKILFAASEVYPLMKTGGLGDVAGTLPIALRNMRHDVRVVMPAYRDALKNAGQPKLVATGLPGVITPTRIWETKLPGSTVKTWLVDSPEHFDRSGHPYCGPDGNDWPDNADRYAAFCHAVTAIALDRAGLDWRPDIVHCNDWQTGLVPALLATETARPATVFTIHNLAYQGLFSWPTFQRLNLPASLWSFDAMEFFGRLSFIKGGLVFADMLSTVSPSYAAEICTPQYGYGLEGLLAARKNELTGILNGADYSAWDPANDALIKQRYDVGTLHKKAINKDELRRKFGLPAAADTPLIGFVGRLVEQKGIDLLLAAMPQLLAMDIQIVILGSGEARFEKALSLIARQQPDRLGVRIGYNEQLAHDIEAGADMFCMPSRFEPCGLNQLYSLRYGTVPVVHRTGGLADTVTDATDDGITSGAATGFVFATPDAPALLDAIRRAILQYRQPHSWQKLVRNGMHKDFGWKRSAIQYLALYKRAEQTRTTGADI